MRRAVGLVCALAAAVSGPASRAAPEAGAPISTLLGLSPAEVRARLTDAGKEWPEPPSFQIAAPGGVLAFVSLDDLMEDPALAELLAVFRTQGDPIAPKPYIACHETLTRADGVAAHGEPVVLVFRDGRLDGAYQPIPPKPEPAPPSTDRKAWMAWVRRPQTSPFLGRWGELPLEDGSGFLDRWPATRLSPDDRLATTCGPPPPRPAPQPARRGHGLDASDMQGLALLPFAVTLPAQNAQRTAARKAGPALLATLRVGQPLGAPADAFAAQHRGVRAYKAAHGDYAVLSIDMGGYPGRNLSNFNDVALAGVRDGRIAWLAPPAAFGPRAALLCLDEHGVPNTPRRGCSGWGQFNP